MGKGSVAHNSRQFKAANVDPERTSLNRRYCNRNIKKVYEELFGEALEKYNAKQTRSDRKIKNYYEKIRTSKQEKPFTELVMQIGNHEDTNAQSEFGAKAAEILDEYMKGFQERNPHLRVFSAYMHMDESTPHLHIDFVPFTTGSKRGLETRVSLKSALAQQGITGGTKYETEWSVFTRREKEQLAEIMERHGIGWKQLDTHEEHLSVLDYKKKMRTQEVEELSTELEALQESKESVEEDIADARERYDALTDALGTMKNTVERVETEVSKYYVGQEWRTPEPKGLMSAKTYKEKLVDPFVKKLKDVIATFISKFLDLTREYQRVKDQLWRARNDNEKLANRNRALQKESDELKLIKSELGSEQYEEILDIAYQRIEDEEQRQEQARQAKQKNHKWEMSL
ncbi:MAG: plasmid recombination protein [Clostridia bacterium]|nr:plasmid recombination protein [Clostridia bacterium]